MSCIELGMKAHTVCRLIHGHVASDEVLSLLINMIVIPLQSPLLTFLSGSVARARAHTWYNFEKRFTTCVMDTKKQSDLPRAA